MSLKGSFHDKSFIMKTAVTASALAAALAFSHDAKGDGWNAEASYIPTPPSQLRAQFCPPHSDVALGTYLPFEQAGGLAGEKGGQIVLYHGNLADKEDLKVIGDVIRGRGFNAELVANGLEDSDVYIMYGDKIIEIPYDLGEGVQVASDIVTHADMFFQEDIGPPPCTPTLARGP